MSKSTYKFEFTIPTSEFSVESLSELKSTHKIRAMNDKEAWQRLFKWSDALGIVLVNPHIIYSDHPDWLERHPQFQK